MSEEQKQLDVSADDQPKDSEDDCQSKRKSKSHKIRIDMNAIPCISNEEQEDELKLLNVTAYHQSIYEEGLLKQVDQVLKTSTGKSHEKRPENVLDTLLHSTQTQPKTLTNLSSIEIVTQNQTAQNRTDESSNANDESECSNESSQRYKSDGELSDCSSQNKIEDKESEDNSEDEDNSVNEDNSEDEDNLEDEEWVLSDDEQYESDEYVCDEDESDDHDENVKSECEINDNKKRNLIKSKKQLKLKRKKMIPKAFEDESDRNDVKRKKSYRKIIDDGNENNYSKRLKKYKKQLIEQQDICPDKNPEFVKLDGDFQISKELWDKLYYYQQDGVKWLWELHQNGCGGIVGDEMGLGKTIQVIAFLSGLRYSQIHNFRDIYKSLGPVMLVCPATVMHQWVAEFHLWWPEFRVAILHSTGSFSGKKSSLIRNINKSNGILITSYSTLVIFQNEIHKYDWHYVILDEGHKIRNPEAQVTFACKMFRTPHRIILSGSPIQNNLKELWSLFDFVYPGKLGTLPVFMGHFSVPITQGGYSNATNYQIQIAYKCATVLRDTIKPYLLRRMKEDVKNCIELPGKNEQVLFCKLTEEQRQLYKEYIESPTIKDIYKGTTQIFVGLVNLRKICNHPDIFSFTRHDDGGGWVDESERYGYYKRSGKMLVVEALLRLWFKQGHKVLLFTQSRKMLNIIKSFLEQKQYSYLSMDGTTPVGSRQATVKQFNEDPNCFIFLLTTRVGGIGVNLIGANRVIIYDPDWNPSTDVQARERCWRIGQDKQVTIYRLLCSGTVEEKIYQRQIFKQYLTNRVLKDPKQKRFFKTNDLHELFTLGDDSETNHLLAGTDSEVKLKEKTEKKSNEKSEQKFELPPEKINELRLRAKELSKMIAEKFSAKKDSNENASNESVSSNAQTSSSNLTKNFEKEVNSTISKSTKKVKKGIKVEGKRIKYLLKQDDYKEMNNQKKSSEQDDYVLKKLFKGSKVQGALQHDSIESTSQEYSIIENEAEKVAKQAIQALKKSRESCYGTSLSVSSSAGSNLSQTKNKFGQKLINNNQSALSSQSMLDQIQKRNRLDPNCANESNNSETFLSDEQNELLSDIRNYLAFQSAVNGEATTQEILDKFRDKIPPHQSAVFKALLWHICDFHRKSDKTGVWRLKQEFR